MGAIGTGVQRPDELRVCLFCDFPFLRASKQNLGECYIEVCSALPIVLMGGPSRLLHSTFHRILSLHGPVFLLHNRNNHTYLERSTEVTWRLVIAPPVGRPGLPRTRVVSE